ANRKQSRRSFDLSNGYYEVFETENHTSQRPGGRRFPFRARGAGLFVECLGVSLREYLEIAKNKPLVINDSEVGGANAVSILKNHHSARLVRIGSKVRQYVIEFGRITRQQEWKIFHVVPLVSQCYSNVICPFGTLTKDLNFSQLPSYEITYGPIRCK